MDCPSHAQWLGHGWWFFPYRPGPRLLDYYYRLQFGHSVYMRLHRDERGKKHVMGDKSVLYALERLFVTVWKDNCPFMRQLSDGACCDMPHNQ